MASADNGRRSLVQVGSTQRALAAAQEYGAPDAYQVFDFNLPSDEWSFAAKWDDTVNKQWTANVDAGIDEWLGDFQTFYRQLWRFNDEEMLTWLESKEAQVFSVSANLDDAGEEGVSNLEVGTG